MEKLASKLLSSISDWAKENPNTVNSMLLAGGAGALAGALLPASSDDPEEGAASRVKRRIRNALIGGAVGAGGAGLLGYGLNQFGTAIPKDEPKPLESVKNKASSGLARAGYGLGALGATGVITEKLRRKARANLVADMDLAGNKSMSNTEKLIKAFKASPTEFYTEAGKHLPGSPKNVATRLARMGVHTSRDTLGKYTKSLLKGNWRRGLAGLGAAGVAAASPEIVSWFSGD